MRCPKCGHDNDQGTLFCEECDWRMDQRPKMEFSFPRIYIPIVAVVIGVLALVLWYFDVFVGAAALGALGMVLGGYSMTFVRITDQSNKMAFLVIIGIAICASVIG